MLLLLLLLLLLLQFQDAAEKPQEVHVEEIRARLDAADKEFVELQKQHDEKDRETLKRQLQQLQLQHKRQKSMAAKPPARWSRSI